MGKTLSWICRRGLRYATLCLLLFEVTDKAWGETCSQAQGEYFRGNLKGAESILLDVLQLNTSRSEAAICWRLLGIVQFSLGKKTHAFNSFEKALAFDGDLSLQSTDTLDPKVVPFFETIKVRRRSSQQPEPPAPIVEQAAPSPEPPQPSPSSPAPPPSEPDPIFAPQKSDPIEDLNDPTVFDRPPKTKSRGEDFGADFLREKGRSKKQSKNHKPDPAGKIISLFPFGIGQFYQQRYMMGVIFAGAEIFTLYRYSTTLDQVNGEKEKLGNFIVENCSAFENSAAGERQKEICLEYASEQQSYIDELESNKMMFLGAFGALVAIGGAEALWYQISSESGESGKKKKKSRKRSLLFDSPRPSVRIVEFGLAPRGAKKPREYGFFRADGGWRNSRGSQRNLGIALHWTLTLE